MNSNIEIRNPNYLIVATVKYRARPSEDIEEWTEFHSDLESAIKSFRHELINDIFTFRMDRENEYWTLHKFMPIEFAFLSIYDKDTGYYWSASFYNSGWGDGENWEHTSFSVYH